jgi:PilZ domain-containing protein
VRAAMTDSSAFVSPQHVEDHRTSHRKKSFLLGKIAYDGGAYSFDCTIRDISQSGARIGIPDGQIVPKQVYLIDMRSGIAYASEVKWRAASQLGLVFTSFFSLDGQLPEETRYLKRLRAGSFNGSNPDAKAVRRADVPTQLSTETPVPPIRQAIARSEISPEMIGAGVAAYAAWKPEEFAWRHSEQDMVRSVFLAMLRAMGNGG